MLRRLALATGAALVLAGATAPALAATTVTFDVFAGKAQTPGDAHGYGYIQWFDNAQRVTVEGTINDLCPQDGRRAQIWILANYNGGYQDVLTYPEDADGCGGGGVPFKHTSKRLSGVGKISSVKVCVWEKDEDGDRVGAGDQACKTYTKGGTVVASGA